MNRDENHPKAAEGGKREGDWKAFHSNHYIDRAIAWNKANLANNKQQILSLKLEKIVQIYVDTNEKK